CIPKLDSVKVKGDQKVGVNIVRRALEEPVRQIVNNTGLEGSIVVQALKEKEGDYGFNAETEKYEPLMAAGVIDPTKVVRIALENAASVSSLLLTTEAVIAEKPEKEKSPPMMPPGGGYGGDMY
ncbi:chaperonin GroEL, partial [bacterium]|nr:chaperonin GroEL [bacterium]